MRGGRWNNLVPKGPRSGRQPRGKNIVTRARISSVVVLMLGAFLFRPATAELTVYKCVDVNGRVQFSDLPHEGCKVLNLPGARPMTIDRAMLAIEERLTDPESARYKSLAQVRRTGAVCGRVNSRNRMGGYDGFKYFAVREVAGRAEVRIEGDAGFYQVFQDVCSETVPGA